MAVGSRRSASQCAWHVLCVAVWGLAGHFASPAVAADRVELTVLTPENWSDFVPRGKEVDAIAGDIVLRNRYATAVIAQPLATRHANMTVRDVGGCLIDFTSRQDQSDQLAAFYPGRRQFRFQSWSAEGDGKAFEIGAGQPFSGSSASVRVTAPGREDLPSAVVVYSLGVNDRCLKIVTSYRNESNQDWKLEFTDDLRIDGGKEDLVKAPNGESERFWAEDRYWRQAYGVESAGRQIQCNTSGNTTQLRYTFDGTSLAAGESATLERSLAAGSSLLHVAESFAAARGEACTSVTLAVRDGLNDAVAGAVLTLEREGEHAGTLVADERGETEFPAIPGSYALQVKANGIVLREPETLVVLPAIEQQWLIHAEGYRPGVVDAEIVDGEGKPVPCKVELIPAGDAPVPDFGPVTAEFAVKNLRYAPDGRFQQKLHPGEYTAIISHGPEYDSVTAKLAVAPGERTRLREKLIRSVDTSGWISSDFHSHASPSGDNTASQLGRVINLVCEHIEFAPCTEHNRVSTYQDHIDQLKISRVFFSCSGMELTGKPLPLNHQNAFPLHHHPHKQDGGGPTTDDDHSTQIERLALWDDRSEKLVQQNHPDFGWLFHDKNGDGVPDDGHARSFGYMDVIEIHPIDAVWNLVQPQQETGNARNRVFHWLQELNQGYRIPGVVNTDAHYNHHGSGGLRNWMESPTDAPAQLKVLDLVHAAEHGHLVMSNGPFLNVWAKTAEGPGDTAGGDLSAPDGKVKLSIRVQSPNWIDIDELFVLINGKPADGLHFSRARHADRFGNGPVKFEHDFDLTLEQDAHLIVVAGAPEKTLGPEMGPSWGDQKPTAISNPIYIDVDGNGFAANKDTLGHPLPVKDGTPKE